VRRMLILFLIIILFSLPISGCTPKDTTPPQVSITSPQNGQTVSGIVTIQALAIDNVGVLKVEFYIDENKVGEDTESPYSYDWDTTQYTNGTHKITAKAYDKAGNVGVSPVINVTIGNQVITFADTNLEKAVRDALGIPVGQPITKEKMQELLSLDAHEKSIYNLYGLEYAINLQELNLYFNKISDISPLANLTKLKYLDLTANQLSDIKPLTNLSNLYLLYLSYNQISDISPLANLTNLELLEVDGNRINDIKPLSNLANLKFLYLGHNQINDIKPLIKLNKLEYLYLSYNKISDINTLANLTYLQRLGLDHNQISNISPLANLTNLQLLCLDDNQINDIKPLANLINLSFLCLDHNQISDIKPLANLTNLKYLDLSYNYITDISPLVYNPGLGEGDEIHLEGNPLNLSEDSINMLYIQILQNRGVKVYY